MTSERQVQQAGENSQQIQAQNLTINSGISEKRVREICKEAFAVARKGLTEEAYNLADQRVKRFEDNLIPKMEKIDGAMNAFADPDFQFLLTNAHRTAAATDRETDYMLLSELLLKRIQDGHNRNVRTGIRRAVEIVDDISDEALLGLTVLFAIEFCSPTTGNITEGLSSLNILFGKICYASLPIGVDWLDQLDVLNAVRISTISSLKKYEEFSSEIMDGYCVVGIKKDSDDYIKAVNMLKENSLPLSLLCNHEINNGYVRISILNENGIDNCIITTKDSSGGTTNKNLTKAQKAALHDIYLMYEKNEKLSQTVKSNFCSELEKYQYIKGSVK